MDSFLAQTTSFSAVQFTAVGCAKYAWKNRAFLYSWAAVPNCHYNTKLRTAVYKNVQGFQEMPSVLPHKFGYMSFRLVI